MMGDEDEDEEEVDEEKTRTYRHMDKYRYTDNIRQRVNWLIKN